jgi:hypothetical protein
VGQSSKIIANIQQIWEFRLHTMKSSFLLMNLHWTGVVGVLVMWNLPQFSRTASFTFFVPSPSRNAKHFQHNAVRISLAFQQMPGENKDMYFKRVTAAASDPKAFERMALDDGSRNSIHDISDSKNLDDESFELGGNPPIKRVYVRAEEWEQEWQEKKKNGKLSWEERVQFDGQRYGNQVNQDDILRRHLKGF